METYCKNERFTLYKGNMLDLLEVIKPCSIDSIVTDPPYGLTNTKKRSGKDNKGENAKGFMGKEWDGTGIEYNVETWHKCYEALKPGGYLLAFGGTRTFHRIACAIEDAGFEIRDVIMWLYGSGFPKSMNIGLAIGKKNGVESHWTGWGTALKPSYEPIIIARKPFAGSLLDNIEEYGVGGLNIDECRVGNKGGVKKTNIEPNSQSKNAGFGCNGTIEPLNKGRFPANTILTYDDTDSEEVCGGMHGYKDAGSAARYFYCAKASQKDRNDGLKAFKSQITNDGRKTPIDNAFQRGSTLRKNTHPTVKPTELMQYLIRLVTPRGGTVLDPFNGSGSTGKAAMYENRERNKGYKYIGIDLDEEYLAISQARIEYAINGDEELKAIEESKAGFQEIKLF